MKKSSGILNQCFADDLRYELRFRVGPHTLINQISEGTKVSFQSLLVQRLGICGSASDIAVTGSLVRTGGELELIGSLEVGIAGGAVGGGVITEIEHEGEHFCTKPILNQCYENEIRTMLMGTQKLQRCLN
jgi:hypothetical protein